MMVLNSGRDCGRRTRRGQTFWGLWNLLWSGQTGSERWWEKSLKITWGLPMQAAGWVLFLIWAEIQFNVNKMNHFKVHSSGVLSTFTVLCNLHLYEVPSRHFHHPRRKLHTHQEASPYWPPPPAPVSMDLPVQSISCEWKHTIWGLFRLLSFT